MVVRPCMEKPITEGETGRERLKERERWRLRERQQERVLYHPLGAYFTMSVFCTLQWFGFLAVLLFIAVLHFFIRRNFSFFCECWHRINIMFVFFFFAAPLTSKPPKILFPAENKMSIMEMQLGKNPGVSSSTWLMSNWESGPSWCLSGSSQSSASAWYVMYMMHIHNDCVKVVCLLLVCVCMNSRVMTTLECVFFFFFGGGAYSIQPAFVQCCMVYAV